MNKRFVLLAILGAIFLLAGVYYKNASLQYLGIGSWLAGLIFAAFFPKFKALTSLVLGLLVLHTGVLLLLKEKIPDTRLHGFIVFTIGIVFVLNSGFSDYIRSRKQ